MADDFSTQSSGLNSPGYKAVTIAASTNPTTLSYVPRGIYIGGAGNLAAIPAGSTIGVTFTGLPAGYILAQRFSIILPTSDGTTVTGLVGMW